MITEALRQGRRSGYLLAGFVERERVKGSDDGSQVCLSRYTWNQMESMRSRSMAGRMLQAHEHVTSGFQ